MMDQLLSTNAAPSIFKHLNLENDSSGIYLIVATILQLPYIVSNIWV